MELLTVFLMFIAFMAVSLIFDITMLAPLCAGFVLFTILSLRKGFTLKQVIAMAKDSLKESFIVVGILLLIGCLTGMWRLSGTVAYFVTLGVSSIPPQVFILSAFLLSAIMSYALGTSFGVAATAGVILMSIARTGGVDTVLAAGAVMSGIYVGDRGSPAASSANLVAVLTRTDMRKNVREMLKTSVLPFALCCVIYALLSLRAPMKSTDTAVMSMLGEEFKALWYCLIPAVLMIILPFCGLGIKLSMAVSLVSSVAVAVFVQNESLVSCLKAMVMGYDAKNPQLAEMLSGGGIVSMLEICGILMVSCSYGKIFDGTGLLSSVNAGLCRASERLGRFPVMLLLGMGASALFCNQTVATIMQSNLSSELYGDSDKERESKMIDMENSVILEAGFIPWCIACSVPLTMLGADARSVPFSFFLWLTPLWWLLRGKTKKPEH
ncbi:MAG: Na+/H+ antiporter NhaC family protein [Bacillota bacterium]|nr:Na+/H+ antiporter NhaC family protein [Bacillota bacterium]